jgi:flagellar biogenesis protein FliO
VGPGQIRTLHTLPRDEQFKPAATSLPDNPFGQIMAKLLKTKNRGSDAS